MQVIVNCKKKLVDYSSNYRDTLRNRFKAKKSFQAEYTPSMQNGSICLTKMDDGQEFYWDASNTKALRFFLDGDRPYVEAIIAGNNDQKFSFVIAPIASNDELGQGGVVAFREDVEALSAVADIAVEEYIDPNPLGICPDDAEDMEQLIEMRVAEGVNIMFVGDGILPPALCDEIPDNTVVSVETQVMEPVEIVDAFDREVLDDAPTAPSGIDALYDFDDADNLGMEDLTEEDFADIDFDELEVDDYIASLSEANDDAVSAVDSPDVEVIASDEELQYDTDECVMDVVERQEEDEAQAAVVGIDVSEEDISGDKEHGEVEDPTMKNADNAIANESASAMPVISDDDIASVAAEMDNAYAQLQDFHKELEARRNSALADIKRIQDEYSDVIEEAVPEETAPELSDYMSTDNAVASVTEADLAPMHGAEDIMDSFGTEIGDDDGDVDAEETEDGSSSIVSKLRDELDHLEKAGMLIDNELNDYDYLLAENRRQCEEFLNNIDTMDGGASAVVAGLITLAQEQGTHNEELNSALKREQALKRHCIDQLGEASKQIEQYKSELDNVRRSLRHSEASRLKSEKFVEDAKTSVSRIVSAAKRKVHQSILQLEAMQAQIDKAEAESAAADNARHAAEIDRDEAFRKRDEALEKLAAEKQHTTELMAECDRQLEGFSNDVLAKMQDQIKRADEAVAAKNASEQRVSDLESELAETRTRLIAAQTSAAKKETDLKEIRKQRDAAESDYGDLMLKFNQQTQDMQETGQTLNDTEAQLVAARGEVKRLEKELVQAKEDRDHAIAERLEAVTNVNTNAAAQVEAARIERDNAVASLVTSKDEAIAANAKLLEAMKSALALPGGFGSRKNKLIAIDNAFNEFIAASQTAQEKGNVFFDDAPIARVPTASEHKAADTSDNVFDGSDTDNGEFDSADTGKLM